MHETGAADSQDPSVYLVEVVLQGLLRYSSILLHGHVAHNGGVVGGREVNVGERQRRPLVKVAACARASNMEVKKSE